MIVYSVNMVSAIFFRGLTIIFSSVLITKFIIA